MIMERNSNVEKLLRELMSPGASEIESPHTALVYKARESVLARKKEVREPVFSLSRLISFFRMELKFYHVGMSLLLVSAGVFYFTEPSYNPAGTSRFIPHDALSITNTTVSVNSSTMLTSIPTLVIRN